MILFLLIGAWPLWGGFYLSQVRAHGMLGRARGIHARDVHPLMRIAHVRPLSQLGSAYAIPSRSMEATLAVGDVVLAEKVSRIVNLPYEVGERA